MKRRFSFNHSSVLYAISKVSAGARGTVPLGMLCLVALALGVLCPATCAQTGEWVWMGGSSTATITYPYGVFPPGIYGTLGVPAAGNYPGLRSSPATWTDKSGNLWLFGGADDYDPYVGGYYHALNDLWEFNPSTNQWVWMGGSSTPNQPGVYGTLGVPAAGNIPGSRAWGVGWTDNNGNFWLFGGQGTDANGLPAGGGFRFLNDLWEFNPATMEWTWMGGNNTFSPTSYFGYAGVYGTLGVPAAGNFPGSRQLAVGSTDKNGNLWLFGGFAVDSVGQMGVANDLWEYNPSTNQWTWISGSSTVPPGSAPPGVYGTLGVPAPGNVPGGRFSANSWTDKSGNFWLFGGRSWWDTPLFSDLWEFNPSTNEWTWMSGSSTANHPGVYGTLGTPAAGNMPGARVEAANWTDDSGNLWLFGGAAIDSAGNSVVAHDLWEYNPATNEWTWMGGNSLYNPSLPGGGYSGVYGTMGIPAATNVPGGRATASVWTDKSGNSWLFGGGGYDSAGTYSFLDDFWEYQLLAAAAPNFSVPGGTYNWALAVRLADTTPNAAIYYTTNGSAPTAASTKYNGGVITVRKTTTINAIAMAPALSNSAVATATYIIDETAAAPPAFSVAPGTYTTVQTVRLLDATKGAVIYYTLDGTTPTTSSATYTGPLTVGESITINAIAAATGLALSPVSTATYVIILPAAAAVFQPPAGSYGQAQLVRLTSSSPNATIYYTTDNSAPSTSSAMYSGPIAVTASETIRTIVVAPGCTTSRENSAHYALIYSPKVLTGLASEIASPNATLSAKVDDFGAAGEVWFLWGTSSSSLSNTTPQTALPASTDAQSVSAALTGLNPGTTYYFQPVVSTVGGTSYGAVQSFATN